MLEDNKLVSNYVLPPKKCITCHEEIARKPGETQHSALQREFCDQSCTDEFLAKYNEWQKERSVTHDRS